MKRLLVCLVGFWGLFTQLAHGNEMKLAVTTSFHNSGLSDVLLPVIKADTGIEVQLLVVGTGQALRLGQAGDVDAILVHSKAAEEAFVAQGYGTHRREIMYNDFVILGPAADPAGAKAAQSATDTVTRIAQSQWDFISRGDNSGTHKKELQLWSSADLDPSEFAAWYKEVGAGMGASLNTASSLNAYIMSDRASWLNFGNKGQLQILFAGDPVLANQYAYLPVNPARHGHVQSKLTAELEAWLTSDTAKELINGYKIAGEGLFTFNAGP
ncbi:substrate-binding domain-containing protein [Algirhabdus cladophorae]|uniref:substrate-binding domain-containing protein n=1 Tax=Algirhabdus cladophorae TaxID=3377108 RepID=UPI003B84B4EC